jgi:hypothetical protein
MLFQIMWAKILIFCISVISLFLSEYPFTVFILSVVHSCTYGPRLFNFLNLTLHIL